MGRQAIRSNTHMLPLLFAVLSATSPPALGDTLPGAAKRGEFAMVKQLVDQGADTNARDSYGVTALMHAAEAGHVAVVGHLLERGADPNLRDTSDGMTALMVSAAEGHSEVVRLLLAAEADVDAKDRNLGATALMGAAEYGHTAVIEWLLREGADANAQDKRGFRALAQAATNGHRDTVRLLVSHGADINAQDHKYGATALMGAVANGHEDVVAFLLEHRPDTALTAKNGLTALDFARRRGRSKIVDLILQADALKQNAEKPRPFGDLANKVYADPKGFFKIRSPQGWTVQEYKADPRGKVDFNRIEGAHKVQLKVIGAANPFADFDALLRDSRGQIERLRARVGGEYDLKIVTFCGQKAALLLIVLPSGFHQYNMQIIARGHYYTLAFGGHEKLYEKYLPLVRASMETLDPVATNVKPEDARAHIVASKIRLARLYAKVGKTRWARTAVKEGLSIDPQNTELLVLKRDLEE